MATLSPQSRIFRCFYLSDIGIKIVNYITRFSNTDFFSLRGIQRLNWHI